MRLLSLVLLVAAASAATLEPTQTLEPRQAVIVATEPPSLSHASPSPTASRSSASSTSFSGSSQAPTSYFIGVTSVSKGTIITASPTSTSSSTLTPWPTVPVAETMGLTMPNPYKDIYVGVPYMFGFVEPGPRPAPVAGGWLRSITPYLIMTNRSVDYLPTTGTLDPLNVNSTPIVGETLCGSLTVYNWAYSYPFIFEHSGWYAFAIKETWLQPTIEDNRCLLPAVQEHSFYATKVFSVQVYPTDGSKPQSPTEAYTVWGNVGTEVPSTRVTSTQGEKLVVGLGVALGFVGLVLCFLIWLWYRTRLMAQNDMIAFSRMKPQEKQEFISSNPDSPYNPHRSSKRYYWQLLCLTPPPGTEPHHIPRARGNSRFVPPAYAHQRSMSVRPLLYGHQHTYSNAPMSQPAYTAYTAPTHLGAPSAYEAPAYHDPYSSKTRDAPLPPLPREAQAPLASTSYKTANDEPDQPSVYGTAYEEFNIPPEHMRASPRSAMRAAQARPNSNVNMVNVPLGSHQPASYQNSAANMAANVPVQQQPPVPPQKSGRAPMTRPIHMSNQH